MLLRQWHHQLSWGLKKQVILMFMPQSSLNPWSLFLPRGCTWEAEVSSGFLARSSRLAKAWAVFFSPWADTGRRMNRQHLQAVTTMWLGSLRPLCHGHIVFDQKYLNTKQVWSVDPNSAPCPPATRSTGQRCLDAEVLLAWKSFKGWSLRSVASTQRGSFARESKS